MYPLLDSDSWSGQPGRTAAALSARGQGQVQVGPGVKRALGSDHYDGSSIEPGPARMRPCSHMINEPACCCLPMTRTSVTSAKCCSIL